MDFIYDLHSMPEANLGLYRCSRNPRMFFQGITSHYNWRKFRVCSMKIIYLGDIEYYKSVFTFQLLKLDQTRDQLPDYNIYIFGGVPINLCQLHIYYDKNAV